jgi:hypothetical protein
MTGVAPTPFGAKGGRRYSNPHTATTAFLLLVQKDEAGAVAQLQVFQTAFFPCRCNIVFHHKVANTISLTHAPRLFVAASAGRSCPTLPGATMPLRVAPRTSSHCGGRFLYSRRPPSRSAFSIGRSTSGYPAQTTHLKSRFIGLKSEGGL